MKEYVLDANAVLSFLRDENRENAIRVRRLFEAAKRGQASLFISAINLGEIFYILRRALSEEAALPLIASLQGVASVIEISPSAAIRAAELKHRYKLGHADSFAAGLAIERKATLVSADPDFEKLGKTIKWLKLQPFRSQH